MPQPVDRGPPGAGAQRGAVAWVEWVGCMLVLMMMAVVVVVTLEDEEEEEEE